MKETKSTATTKSSGWLACLLIGAALVVLFWKCFLPDYVHFSNDGPLGLQNTAWISLPQGFFGQWVDNWGTGWSGGAAWPEANSLIHWALGNVGYAKFLIPISLFLLGYGAYFFFRRSGLTTTASILGGLAACLTTNFFSDGCWGAAPAVIAFGLDFLALGALAKRDKGHLWFFVGPALAGFAVGLNVMEAADIGMLFSLVIAAFAMYQSFLENGSPLFQRLLSNAARTAVMTGFAIFIALYSIFILVGMNVKGIAGTQQDVQAKAQRWDFAVEWSLPKRETLSLIIPGLFGDRVDYNDERAYWGSMGRDASWDRYYHQKLAPGDMVQLAVPGTANMATLEINSNGDLSVPPIAPIKAAGLTRFELQSTLNDSPLKGAVIQYVPAGAFPRHTGRGVYFGLLIVIVGLWAAFQSFRSAGSVFTIRERRFIWFWSVAALIALLLAHGKYSPFASVYYWLYTILPYSSTVRSPEKFLHVMNFSVLILFGYGVDGIKRQYFDAPLVSTSLSARLKSWWARAAAFDKRWVAGCVVAIFVAAGGALVYAIYRPAVERYLQDVQFPAELARMIAGYSLRQVLWFTLFLVLDCGLLLLIFSGAFAGQRAKWGGILLGVLLVWDLGRADMQFNNPFSNRWDLGFWNYKQKYEVGDLNPICTVLANKPYEHRVQQLPDPPFRVPEEGVLFKNLYDIEWLQQIFPYYNIQSLDIEQLPRYPQDMIAFERAAAFPGTPPFTRHWELTNTRYLLGPTGYVDVMNQQLDPVLKRFSIVKSFRVEPKAGVEQTQSLAQMTAVPSPQGEDALIEFRGALPRVKLYSTWETNSPETLRNFTTKGLDGNQLAVFQTTGTNDFLTLKKLVSPDFNPAQTVLLSEPIAVAPSPATTNQNPGEVEFASYAPSDIKLNAKAATPCVLLLNDRYDPMWQVWVDGKQAGLLRCNYIMRGVFLQPGQHEVEFRFRQPVKMLWVNIAAILVGLVLLGYAVVATRKQPPTVETRTDKGNPKREAISQSDGPKSARVV